MNTTATATTSTATRGFGRRILHLLLAVPATLVLMLGGLSVAAPAHAAGNSSTGLSFCTNSAYLPVTLKVWNGSNWVNYKSGKSGSNGCGTFRYLDGNRWYYVDVAYTSGRCFNPYMTGTYGNSQATWVNPNAISNAGYFGTTTYVLC